MPGNNRLVDRLKNAGAVLAIAALISPSLAAENKAKYFDIEAQPLSKALLAFSEQSDIVVSVPTQLVSGKEAPAVKGDIAPDEALDKLLQGSGLEYDRDRDGGVMIVQAALQEARRDEPFRMAQVGQRPSSDTNSLIETNDGDDRDVIVVTGTSIRGVTPESSPLDIYTRDDIRESGAISIDDFARLIPQNLNSNSFVAPTSTANGNSGAVSAIDLRGAGVGSTLVLVNGRRLPNALTGTSPDVSMLPLAALDRVEVLTDGASSIYGSDAVAGVVNFVLRDDFEGAVTSVDLTSTTDGDFRGGSVAQTVGAQWDSGGILGSVGYRSSGPLDAADRDYANTEPAYLVPVDQRFNAFVSAHQSVTDQVEIFTDLLYASRDVKLVGSVPGSTFVTYRDTEQFVGAVGANIELSTSTNLEIVSTYAIYERTGDSNRFFDSGAFSENISDVESSYFDVTAKIDGALFQFNGNDVRYALGGGIQKEGLDFVFNGDLVQDIERETTFAFGELFLPLIQEQNNIPLVNRLEANLSGRYTDIEAAGDSFDPKVGVLWEVIPSLKLRSTYSTSFRAPRLNDLETPNPTTFLIGVDGVLGAIPDPFSNDRSTVYYIFISSDDPNLGPETSEAITAGVDFEPSFFEGLKVSGTYYRIDYTDRIGAPFNAVTFLEPLFNPSDFLTLFEPTTADSLAPFVELAQLGDIAIDTTGSGVDLSDPNAVASVATQLLNLQIQNLSSRKIEGLDFSLVYNGSAGDIDYSVGTTIAHFLTNEDVVFDGGTPIDRLNSVAQPVDTRLQGFVGLSSGGLAGRLTINHTPSYTNRNVLPNESIDAWTTVDLSTSYDLGSARSNLLSGLRLSIVARNLFDEDPPFVAASGGGTTGLSEDVGFDPVNADPFGRTLTLSIIKEW